MISYSTLGAITLICGLTCFLLGYMCGINRMIEDEQKELEDLIKFNKRFDERCKQYRRKK